MERSWRAFKKIKEQQLKQGAFCLKETNGQLQPLINSAVEAPIIFPNFFSPQQCELILKAAESLNFNAGSAVGDDNTIRKSDVTWLWPNKDNAWIFDYIENVIMQANKKFKFDITGFFQGIQIAKYGEEGKYDWHNDLGDGSMSHRKLSISVLLNNPDEYSGGELEFMGIETEIPKTQGTAIIFPPYITHRVAPVTKGMRCSLVSWISGPPFK